MLVMLIGAIHNFYCTKVKFSLNFHPHIFSLYKKKHPFHKPVGGMCCYNFDKENWTHCCLKVYFTAGRCSTGKWSEVTVRWKK